MQGHGPCPCLSEADIEAYRSVAGANRGKTARNLAEGLAGLALETDPERRFERLLALFATRKGEPRSLANAAPRKVEAALPGIGDRLAEAGALVLALADRLRTLRMLNVSCAALVLARRLDHDYEALKRRGGRLDFEDLVSRTAALLRRDGAGPWVHYKLDQGIDHILVDEAQDTSPEQWSVITRLSEEFFAGESARSGIRTLFAVGDEKQSIYSFQGARPELFMQTGRDTARRARHAERHFEALRLHLSFRSTLDVLSAVDAVFAADDNRRGLSSGNEPVSHDSNRSGEPGV